MSHRNQERRNWIGVSLLILGAAFLFENFNWHLFSFPHYFNSWKFALVVVGFILLVGGYRLGIGLMMLGAFLLWPDYFFQVIHNLDQWWPVLLILVGLVILIQGTRYQHKNNNSHQ